MRVAIYGPNLGVHNEQEHVHAVGCADTKKRIYVGHEAWVIEAADQREVVHAIFPPGEFDYTEDSDEWRTVYATDIKFFPCTGLPEVAEA